MIITCNKCNKKFEIDQKLIPSEGRLLQCGSCNNRWFFKPNEEPEIIKEEFPQDDISIYEKNPEDFKKEESLEVKKNIDKYKKKKINYFKIILVGVISIVAFILIIDTFKIYLSSIFPKIDTFLDNLYLSIEDIKLFMLDLIK